MLDLEPLELSLAGQQGDGEDDGQERQPRGEVRRGGDSRNTVEREPEMAGPKRKPIPNETPMTPKARVRFSGLVTSLMYAWAMLRLPAVSPSIMRPTKSIHRCVAPPMTRKAASVPIWLARSTGLRPMRSESRPSTGLGDELRGGVAGPEDGDHEVGRVELLRVEREHGQHQRQTEDVDEDRQEDGQQRGRPAS